MLDYIKVLEINYINDEYGGVPVFLMNVFRNLDHDRYQLDFLTPDRTSYNPWRHEIESAGGNIYEFHINVNSRAGKRRFGIQLRNFFKDQTYDIVHINCGVVSFNCIAASAAKAYGSKVIVHSHSNGGRSWWKNVVVFFLKRRLQRKSDVMCACSTEAARNIFTRHKVSRGDVVIINNGINLQKFRYDSDVRSKMRKELKIEGCYVVGHVGRFAEPKNHEFLIDIFAEILKKEPRAVLMLIGEGELEEHIRDKVLRMNMKDHVMFMGQRNDVADLYQAMDVFLFPSLFEGLGLVLIEAQACGLPSYISDVIPVEVDLTSLIHRVSLQASAEEWAQNVLSIEVDSNQRCDHIKELETSGYGIQDTASQISEIYESLCLSKR